MINKKHNYSLATFLFASFLFVLLSCSRDSDDLELATFPSTAEVFIDGFSAGLQYQSFGTSKVTAFEVDNQVKYKGSASMRFDIPNADDPAGGFAAGIFLTEDGRDLSSYTALTFWAKASQAASIDELGFGFTFDDDKFKTSVNNLKVSTAWIKYYIPIPDASKLNPERGLFYYVDTPDNELGYTFWVDEVKFETLNTVAYKTPQIFNGSDVTESAVNGATIPIDGLSASFNLPHGVDQSISLGSAYFEFNSSNTNVAIVDDSGIVTVLSEGSAVITAKLGEADATGSLTVTSAGDFVHAPTPMVNSDDVISIFSNAYTNVPVEYYNGYWAPFQTTLSADFEVDGDDVLNYTNFNFVGTQFTMPTVDASNMTHLHVDIYIPNEVNSSDQFAVSVIDLGPDAAFGDPDPSILSTYASPNPLVAQSWIGLDISLNGLSSKDKLAQIIFENLGSNLTSFYADNIYFYNEGGEMMDTEPTVAAPIPTSSQENVISIFSDAFTNIDGTNLNPDWGQATVVSEKEIEGNNTLVYTGLNYQGIELGSSQDVSEMDFLHLDYWTSNSSALNTFIISPGPIETGSTLQVPTSGWSSVDIPLGDFSPVNLADLIQMKFDGNGNIFLDNIYFYKEESAGNMPTQAAPTPTQDESNVISVYSDSYMNINGININPDWGQATQVSEVVIDGNTTMLYSGLNYQGLDLGGSQDLQEMEFLHLDIWSANSTSLNTFLISNGPVEKAYPIIVPTSGWSSIDIPLGNFTPVDLSDVFQMKFEGDGEVYLDNIYFYGTGGNGGGDMPTQAAPVPTQNEADVISVFSDSYQNIENTDLNPNWGQATQVSQLDIQGNNTLLYIGLNYQGITLGSPQDVSSKESFHVDIWTANSKLLNVSLISSGPAETAYSLSVPTNGWSSIDIQLSEFPGVDLGDIIQLKFDGDGDIYLDNLFFYGDSGGGGIEPSQAAPTPLQDAGEVTSIYSDAFIDIPGTDFNPNWGQATVVTEVEIDGNSTLLYSGLNYQGTMLSVPQDFSDRGFLHLDFWSVNSDMLSVFLISPGPNETAASLSVPTSGWRSIDIPLSAFSGVDLADVIQFKFEGNGDIYLDNIYFHGTSSNSGYTIDLPIDFETTGNGSNWTWSVFENDSNPPVEFVSNPDPSGINTSSTVAQITALQTGNPWVGCETMHGSDFTTFTLDESNAIVRIMVYKSVISDVGLKFALPSGEALPEIKVANTVVNQWEELTFDFSSRIGHPATIGQDQIVVFPDFDLNGRTSDNVIYFDNITFSGN
ncbi:MAG: hypothetical protein HKO66_01520 [Saprospiraceae bacterium]|nr:Ig-like domain-containing protein [Bacteroidia bacterium]NNL90888.1 hypothetical protein [Saprospiraceae bacterium]